MRRAVPELLDAAGLSCQADALRSLGPIECVHSAARAVCSLDRMSEALPESMRPLSDILFWCEAAVFSAACYDAGSFRFCVAALRRDVDALLATLYDN